MIYDDDYDYDYVDNSEDADDDYNGDDYNEDDGDDDDDDYMGDQESAWKQSVPPYYRESLFCGLPPTSSRSIPYFEFSPQMSRMIRANIGCRRPGLGYPTPDWEAGGQIDGTAAADAYGLM